MEKNPVYYGELTKIIQGETHTSLKMRSLYSTDASVYGQLPEAIVLPQTTGDIKNLILFATKHHLSLIPRGAGTSLAGQVVGKGIVVDISKYLNRIIELNVEEKWVKVQPGVVLSELNRQLAKHKLYFGPETSTANRCTIGGMIGNNACGLRAVIYGTTRDHLLSVSGFLSDGSYAEFGSLDINGFHEKCKGDLLENRIYKHIKTALNDSQIKDLIHENYPDNRVIRRNHGYAIDSLLTTNAFARNGNNFNLSKLIAGSEGTLMFITEAKLSLVDLPSANKALICAHFNSVHEALLANKIALKHGVSAVELMDSHILEASRNNKEQFQNTFFVRGNPKAILLIEVIEPSQPNVEAKTNDIIFALKAERMGYHYPVLQKSDIQKAWELRKAGLGVLANLPGDAKPVTVVEDTAVNTDDLPEYISEFAKIMTNYGEDCVYHAHAGTGEIHIRPRLDLKKADDVKKFESLAWEVAKLVKKYRGSLSGEHGDGRLRGQFIPYMYGKKIYQLHQEIKNTWDPQHVFNPGIIVDTPSITENLKSQCANSQVFNSKLDFTKHGGFYKSLEQCTGSGDCRKSHLYGGTMCPSYMVTQSEQHVTRGRANLFKQYFIKPFKANPFEHPEMFESLDLCLMCKACKSECPGNVDIAKVKTEFLFHYYKTHRASFRTRLFAHISKLNGLLSKVPGISNFVLANSILSKPLKLMFGIAPQRSFPPYSKLADRLKISMRKTKPKGEFKGNVALFIDEFTLYNDAHLAVMAIRLLGRLGYHVKLVHKADSGRALISKGFLNQAQSVATKNIKHLGTEINTDFPLIGIEPSAVLSFRDEYPDLVSGKLKEQALELAKHTYLVEEFLAKEFKLGKIDREQFTKAEKTILVHGHCQHKALGSIKSVIEMLSIPERYSVTEIPSGCCGMAGSFGYEKEHYHISIQVGELVLFPAIRALEIETLIVANGTSCRQQIADGTGRKALHPVQVLFEALKNRKAR